MLRSLIRSKFVNRTLGTEDLEAFANFWLRLYEEAEHPAHKSWVSHQTIEIQLTGFTRSSTQAISDELKRRFSEADMPVEVSLLDPDTLVAKTARREGNRPPFPGLGISALAGSPFDGLVIELRFTVADPGPAKYTPELVGAAFVLVGQLRSGAIVAKSVWVEAAYRPMEGFWNTQPEWEEGLLTAFDNYRGQAVVDREFAIMVFNHLLKKPATGVKPAFQRAANWLFDVPLGSPRAGRLLWRWSVALASVPVLILFVWIRPFGTNDLFVTLPPIIFGVVLVGFASKFFEHESPRLARSSDPSCQWYEVWSRTDLRSSPATADDLQPWVEDPVVRKLTQEVLEAGFAHAGDAIQVPTEKVIVIRRIFLAPDGVTSLVLAFESVFVNGTLRWEGWPAKRVILCQTFNSAGCRFETWNNEPPLVALKRNNPEVTSLVLSSNIHPLELYQAHVKAVENWRKESNSPLCPHESFERVVSRLEEIAQQERKLYLAKPYSLRDHLRWYLQLDAKPSDSGK